MDLILLPAMDRTTPPPTALEIMKDSRRSVAVVLGSVPQGLITSLEVRKAKNRQQFGLEAAELEPLAVLFDGDFVAQGYWTLKLPANSFAAVRDHLLGTFPGMAHRQLIVPRADLAAFEQLLPPAAMHGFLGYDRGAAVVMTRHESLADQAAGPPPDCCCLNPATPHEYQAGTKKMGQACDNCTFIVEC